MKTKAAVQTIADAPLEVVELEVPSPGYGQVCVELIASGICHSQLHQMENPTYRAPWCWDTKELVSSRAWAAALTT